MKRGKKKTSINLKMISLNIEQTLIDLLDNYCLTIDKNRTEIINKSIIEYLKRNIE